MEDPHSSNRTFDTSTFIVLIVSLVLITLNILRILCVPMTHDEALTYNMYVAVPWLDIISMHPTSANDHILNSLLCKVFTGLFGNGQFCLRFTNLLAQVAYMYFSFRVVRHLFTDKVFTIAGFLLLNLNPFLFEFWGLCRGYGLSIAFMMGSIYFLLRYLRYSMHRTLWYCLLMGMAAVYSNYSLLYFFLALPVITAYPAWARGSSRKAFFKEFKPVWITSLLLFLTVVGNIKALHDDEQLYYGGDNGLVPDTVASLLRESIFAGPGLEHLILIMAYTVVIIIAGAGIYFLTIALSKRNEEKTITGISLYLLLLVPILAISVHHSLLGSKYVIERTALFLFPLFLLPVLLVIVKAPRVVARLLFIAFAFTALADFAGNFNFKTARSWPDDAPVLLVLNKIAKEKEATPGLLKVRADWRVQPALQYYIATKYKSRFAAVAHIKDPVIADTGFDYYYIHRDDLERVPASYSIDTVVNRGRFILLKK